MVVPEGAAPATDQRPTDLGGIREVKSAARTVELLELLAARGNQPARPGHDDSIHLADGLGTGRHLLFGRAAGSLRLKPPRQPGQPQEP